MQLVAWGTHRNVRSQPCSSATASQAAWQHGAMAVWQHGSMAAWQHGAMAA